MAVDAMGEKATELIPISILLHIGHVFIHEVLRGVLYPEVHGNGNGRQKKKVEVGLLTNPITLSE